MTGKVKCTCGWSWDKSDSSKKDMYVCHECGRDNSNNMKNGGWLDNYGEEDNYNDSSVSAPEGFRGDGYSNVGRNYSPAWGGQFQMGGSVYPVNYVPQAQNSKLTFLQPNSDKLPEGYIIPYDTPSSERAMSIGGEDEEPAYLIPSFKYGKPLADPIEEFKKTGEHLGGPFKTWQEADKWEQEVRHPAVEKKENIMFPQEQFAMGGSIPGAVGFSYARTQSPAPSNGKYAKKTMASAQNGKEMQYYQNGLDWQPKTISKNGAWLDNYDKAQNGEKKFKLKDERDLVTKPSESTNVKKKNFDLEQSKSNKTYINQLAEQQKETKRRKTLTQDQREREDYNARNEERGSIKAPVKESKWDRTKAIASNPLTAFGYAARNESLPARFQHGERNALDTPIDFINPLQGIAALSEIPGELGRGEYLNAGLSALDAVDLGVYAKGAMKASKPFLQEAGTALGTEVGSLSNLSNFGDKTKSFIKNNIFTDKTFNRLETVNNSLEKLNKVINPLHHIEAQKSLDKANSWMNNWYNDPITKEKIKEASSRYGPNSYNEQKKKLLENIESENYKSGFESNLNKLDNLILGNPRVHKGNYGVSGMWLDTHKDLSKRQNLVDKYIHPDMITSTAIHEGNHGLTQGNALIRGYEDVLHSPFDVENFKPRLDDGSFEKHSDYLLDPTEINARLSEIRYEHNLRPGENLTSERVDNILEKGLSGTSKVDPEFFNLINDRDKFRQMMNYVPAVTGAIGLGAVSQLEQKKEGGIIKDDRGQWDHPGEITEISGDTMATHGYGDIPLYVVPDKGTPRLVQPNTGTQKFPGAKKFTEYPMAQGGKKVASSKKESLLNLTDLTYTPQELEYMNDVHNGYCPGGNCLESSRKAYDMTAGKIKGFPSSNDIWTNDLKLISTPDKPSEQLVQKNPYFRGDENFGSADSWDIHGAIVKAGGKNIYSQAKGQTIPVDIPVGAVAGWGPSKTRKTNHDERSQGMNIDYGLQPSHHSTESVGYNDKGEPIFYDSYTRKYGTIEEVKQGLNLLGYELENVSVPKSVAANTKENINKRGLLKNELTPFSVDINKLISATSKPWAQINEDGETRSAKPDKDKLTKFAQALIDNKGELVSSLGLTNSEYDRLANSALAISMTESEGGGALNFIDNFGSTKGMTQLNIDNVKKDDRLKSARNKKYKGNGNTFNLTDPYNSAIATMMYLSVAEKDAKRLYDKGLKPGERSFNEPGLIEKFRSTNSRLNKEGVFIDELNKRVPYSQIPGYEDNDVNKVNSYFKKMTKSDRYNFVDKDGDMSLKVKTKGNNPELTDIEKLGYMWQSPNSLKTGDAQGDSQYVSRIKNYYQALQSKKRNGGSINQQDEKTLQHIDQLTNFTNYNTKQPGGWLDTL